MRQINFSKYMALAFAAMLTSPVVSAEELDKAAVDKYSKMLSPDKNELWRTIPWKISLLEARKEAAEKSKPMFIWAMDGHPLACV